MLGVQIAHRFAKFGKADHDAFALFRECEAYEVVAVNPFPQILDVFDNVLFCPFSNLFCLLILWRKRKTVVYLRLKIFVKSGKLSDSFSYVRLSVCYYDAKILEIFGKIQIYPT